MVYGNNMLRKNAKHRTYAPSQSNCPGKGAFHRWLSGKTALVETWTSARGTEACTMLSHERVLGKAHIMRKMPPTAVSQAGYTGADVSGAHEFRRPRRRSFGGNRVDCITLDFAIPAVPTKASMHIKEFGFHHSTHDE